MLHITKKKEAETKEGLLICAVRELPAHFEHFQTASKVRKAEGEDQEKVTRFKYACGKNAAKVESAIKSANVALTKLSGQVDGYEDYLAERNKICEEFCKRTPDGSPEFIGGSEDIDHGSEKQYTFTPENLKKATAAIKVMEKQFSKVLSAEVSRKASEEKILDETVEIVLHMIEWKEIPENISGTYLAVLTPMLKNIPEEVKNG